jgi:hypothetical protein
LTDTIKLISEINTYKIQQQIKQTLEEVTIWDKMNLRL